MGMRLRRSSTESRLDEPSPIGSFAHASDYVECRRLQRQYGTTYYFATRLFPASIRERVYAIYGFVRVPDEWVDNPGTLSVGRQREILNAYRNDFLRGLDGVPPQDAVLRAFCDVMRDTGIPMEEPLRFLDAMEQDLTVTRYETYADLRHYMRGSASTVGVMMCHALGAGGDTKATDAAMALGEAMQLTNFLRDVGEDLLRGRIYLPREDLDRFGLDEAAVLDKRLTPSFVALMRFEIARARELYAIALEGVARLPKDAQRPIRLAALLYSRILDRIEANEFDVFTKRARTSRLEKMRVLASVLLAR